MSGNLHTRTDAESRQIVEDWGALTWLANQGLSNSSITLGRVVIYKGKSNPRHCHNTCEEVLYLLRGTLRHSLGEQSVTMHVGDTLIVPAGVMHNAENVGDEDADMMIAYSSGRRDFQQEA